MIGLLWMLAAVAATDSSLALTHATVIDPAHTPPGPHSCSARPIRFR